MLVGRLFVCLIGLVVGLSLALLISHELRCECTMVSQTASAFFSPILKDWICRD